MNTDRLTKSNQFSQSKVFEPLKYLIIFSTVIHHFSLHTNHIYFKILLILNLFHSMPDININGDAH